MTFPDSAFGSQAYVILSMDVYFCYDLFDLFVFERVRGNQVGVNWRFYFDLSSAPPRFSVCIPRVGLIFRKDCDLEQLKTTLKTPLYTCVFEASTNKNKHMTWFEVKVTNGQGIVRVLQTEKARISKSWLLISL